MDMDTFFTEAALDNDKWHETARLLLHTFQILERRPRPRYLWFRQDDTNLLRTPGAAGLLKAVGFTESKMGYSINEVEALKTKNRNALLAVMPKLQEYLDQCRGHGLEEKRGDGGALRRKRKRKRARRSRKRLKRK